MSDQFLQLATPLRLIYDALMRPTRFAAFLERGWRAVAVALATTLGLIGLTFGAIALSLRLLGALNWSLLIVATMSAVVLVSVSGYLCSMLISQTSPTKATFWCGWLRCLIAMTPLATLLMNVGLSPAFAPIQNDPSLIILALLVIGAWGGGGLAVGLLMARPAHSSLTRWILAGGGLILAAQLWLTPARSLDATILALIAAGSSLGFVRPLSYLWQGPLSLALALAARADAPAERLLKVHPVRFDELILIPLPGLRGLLIRACMQNLSQGGEGLLEVAQHGAQHSAAHAAVIQIVREGQLTHELLLWLSTRPAGIALIGRIRDQRTHLPPLIDAYSAFAAVQAPEEWASALNRQRATIDAARTLPHGVDLATLLSACQAALDATRWDEATAALDPCALPAESTSDLLGAASAVLRWWMSCLIDTCADPHMQQLLARLDAHSELAGWPTEMIAAVGEHLLFLLAIESRRAEQVKE